MTWVNNDTTKLNSRRQGLHLIHFILHSYLFCYTHRILIQSCTWDDTIRKSHNYSFTLSHITLTVMDWIVSSQILFVEAETSVVTIFGDRTYKKIIHVNCGSKCGVVRQNYHPKKRRKKHQRCLSLSAWTQKGGYLRIQQEGTPLKARKICFTRSQPQWHPDLEIMACRLWENIFLSFNSDNFWYF